MSLNAYPDTPHIVGSDEVLIRHLIKKKWLPSTNAGHNMAKHEAFMPVIRKRATGSMLDVLGLSVTRKLSLTVEQIKQLGKDVVYERSQKDSNQTFELAGLATFSASLVRKLGLDVQKSEPPSHHADIVGWDTPIPSDVKARTQINRIKVKLASVASVVVY